MKILKYLMVLMMVFGLVSLMPLATQAEEAEPDATVTEADQETADQENIGETLLALIESYAGELLATITLAVSLFNTYRYQKGLVPMLYRGLKNVAGAAANATDQAQATASHTEAELAAFMADMRPLMARMVTLCEGAEAISKEAEALRARIEEGEIDRETTKRWMRGVADMLYRVFTSANLPQYAKDAIGAEYQAITQAAEVSAYAEQYEGNHP